MDSNQRPRRTWTVKTVSSMGSEAEGPPPDPRAISPGSPTFPSPIRHTNSPKPWEPAYEDWYPLQDISTLADLSQPSVPSTESSIPIAGPQAATMNASERQAQTGILRSATPNPRGRLPKEELGQISGTGSGVRRRGSPSGQSYSSISQLQIGTLSGAKSARSTARLRTGANQPQAGRYRKAMFSIGQNSKVLGAGHLVLNILRALTMIGLLIVMAAVWAMIVLSILKGHFDFFDTISHVFIFFTSIFLFVSELNLRIFRGWFERNWPVLSQYHSLAWLGIAQIVIGCAVLGDLVKPGYSQETIGLAFWRAIVAAGILSLTFGWFNIFASIIFRIPESNITARMIRSEGSLAPQRAANKTIEDVLPHEYPPSLSHRDHFFPPPPTYFKQPNEEPSRVKRLTQVLNPKNFRKSRIQISKPIPQETSGFEQTQQTASSPKNQFSPIAPEIQRPPSTLHPMYTGSSRYSEAHMSRW